MQENFMQTRIIVNGAHGKMGAMACATLKEHPDFILVGELGRKDDLRNAIKEQDAQVVVDLTRADCVYQNTVAILESGAHPVVGTTGLLSNDIQALKELSEKKSLGGIIVPNFSISAILMMRFAAMASHYFPEVEIIEMHHQQKQDAPSGTALKTAQMIAAARKNIKNKLHIKELIPGACGGKYEEIPIHSVRLPGILARQQVIFGSMGETLTITDDAIDRNCYMPGLVLACQQVTQLKSLYYGLEHVLEN
jgi:4-hydroxy-tetrahydrodipicolinate reductase